MTDFLLELRSEEIPARMQARAREDLARLFAAELAKAGLSAGETITYATPRRLALIARGLPEATEAVSEEVKGPKASAPSQALEGFLRKTGLTRDQLVDRDGILFAVTQKPGRATADVLAEAIPAIVRAFPWPKSMRWGAASASTGSPRWVRPLQGIVALFGDDIVAVEAAGITGGAATLGHRFHHPGIITIGGAHDYVEKLRACHVIVDPDERADLIRTRARELAAEAGLELVDDEGLVAENAGLTEWPVPLLGRFDAEFLSVPPEVIQLTARVNQKYFVCRTADGALANAFVCTANIDATDGGAKIVEGNRKVLAARLADARFFYDTDLKVPLEEQAKKLEKIVFHEKLGTLADKVDRVAKLARWLVEEEIVGGLSRPGAANPVTPAEAGVSGDRAGQEPRETSAFAGVTHEGRAALATLAERAARLAKADLVTGMVGEFPELQGLIGGYYAKAQGEPREVWEAVRDHYKPIGQGDDVPTAPVTVAVSLSDKLDTFISFFRLGEFPTGSRDPFALRRAVLAIMSLLTTNDIRVRLQGVVDQVIRLHRPRAYNLAISRCTAIAHLELPRPVVHFSVDERRRDNGTLETMLKVNKDALFGPFARDAFEGLFAEMAVWHAAGDLDQRIFEFAADRLKVQQREAGVRHDLIDAVFALGGEDDLVRLLARVRALQAFVGTEDGANLLAGYKRAANILKKEGWSETPLPAREEPGVGGESPTGIAKDRPTPGPSLAGRGAEGLPYTPEPAESALIAALDVAEPAAARAVDAEDFEGAMAALAMLRAPIDAFFEAVTVNDPAPDKRAARLALLARVRTAVHTVADFSRIEG